MTPFDFILLALAACYWAFVLVKKGGPWNAFKRLRSRTTVGGLLECPACLVFWTAALLYLGWQWEPTQYVVTVSAIAGGATFIGYYSGMWQQP